MPARTLIGAATLLAGSISLAGARDLVVALPAPDLLAPWQSVFIDPFTAATGIAVSPGIWSGGATALSAQKPPDISWDLVMLDGGELAASCASGVLSKLDWTEIGGRSHYQPIAVSDCGVGATVANTVLAWDRDKLASPPGFAPSWADFWDVTKYPGKRGLWKGVRGNLEIALMADGVAPGDVYKVLATSDGVDRAFRKLDQLRPFLVWWSAPEDASRILASGEVLMTSAPSSAIIEAGRAQRRNFAIQWSNGLYDVLSWAILKASPELRQAIQFLYFSGTPAIEARLPEAAALGGLAKGANEGLPDDIAADSPTSPTHLQAELRFDTAFWQANRAKLKERFDAWLAH